MKKGWIHEQER